MFTKTITPRFYDTDALMHINNAAFVSWFEDARRPIFKMFNPELDPKIWNLIIAKVEVEYLNQTKYQEDVIIETEFEKIGNSSMTILQRAIQNNIIMAIGKCVMIHFDYINNKSVSITVEIKEELTKHLITQ